MTTDDRVSELLARAKRAKTMAGRACSPEHKRIPALIAADYERLAHCQLIILNTQRHLSDSRRLLGGFSPSAAEAGSDGC
jgi:hypothetical protein